MSNLRKTFLGNFGKQKIEKYIFFGENIYFTQFKKKYNRKKYNRFFGKKFQTKF